MALPIDRYQLGPPHADLLEVVFGILFQMSLEIPLLLRNRKLFGDSEEIKHELAVAYAEILMVVCEATVHYIKTKRGTTHHMGQLQTEADENLQERLPKNSTVSVVTGSKLTITTGSRSQSLCGRTAWNVLLRNEVSNPGKNALLGLHMRIGLGINVGVQTIREWLSPKDRVLRRVLENDQASRAEFTCEWFESHLIEFCTSRNDMFLVTGASGCGKSVLSSWIIERLQRPLGRRSFDVVSVKIGNYPSDPVVAMGRTLTYTCSCGS